MPSSMIVKPECVEGLINQIQNEFTASAQYVAIAAYFDHEGLPVLTQHFYKQSEEERVHALKFVKYLLDAGARPIIKQTHEIRNDFASAQDAVQCSLESELMVTSQINELVATAVKNNDYMTHTFLQWFVTEQLEEVSSMSTLLNLIKHAGNSLLLVEDHVRRMADEGPAAGE